jgi:Zn-dependent oligopeptidase
MIQDLRFDLSPSKIKTLSDSAFQAFELKLDQISKNPRKEAIFELEWALAHFSNALGVALFLKYVSPDPEVRKAADEVETRVQKFLVDIFAREDLYEAILFSQKHLTGLSEVETELLNDTLFHFTKNGLGLDPSLRKTFIEKKKRLIECESEFSKNLLEENTILEFSKAELEGLSEDFIQSLKLSENQKYQVTLSYPHVTAFMENVKSTEARKRLSFYFNTRGGKRNREAFP